RRSAPDEKFPPAPVRTMQRISGSLEAATKASYIRTSMAPDSAFRRCGRFIVTTRRWPSRSTIASGMAIRYDARARSTNAGDDAVRTGDARDGDVADGRTRGGRGVLNGTELSARTGRP